MNTQALRDLFDQLDVSEKKQQLAQARDLIQTILNRLLKSVYSAVRGQAPPRIMRDLMELEIDIGGEDGDFKTFDNRRMIDLFKRGQVFGFMEPFFGDGDYLFAAMDLDAVERWLLTVDGTPKRTRPATVRFVHQWLKLFAEEAGILDPAEPADAARSEPAKTSADEHPALPEPGKPYTDSVAGISFAFIPGGTFPMGDAFGDGAQDEQPVHEVSVSPFYMAIHPVTQAQWTTLMHENPSRFIGDHHPVEQVAFPDVMAFIEKLNGASPKGVYFDLPSEAQWEYAARSGGLEERYAGGQDPEPLAWLDTNTEGRTAPVGTRLPNGLGLYDMSGNVWEWCRDIYEASAYRHHAGVDPVCTAGGKDRVIRGGSWHLDAWSIRCSRRFRFDPELFGPALGFRLVMTVETEGAEDSRARGGE